MKKETTVTLIIGLILMGIGLVLIAISHIGGGRFRDFNHQFDSYSVGIIGGTGPTKTENYDYSSQEVRSLEIDIAATSVTLSQGENFTVRIKNTNDGRIYSELESNGTLKIDEKIFHRWWWYWNFHEPKVYITIPKGSHFESINIEVAAGRAYGKNLEISTTEADFSVDAGSIELSEITSTKTDIDGDVGEIMLSGTFSGETKIDCNVGSIKLHTTGNIDQWNYTGRANMGNIRINNKNISDITNTSAQKNNHFDIDCNIGSVEIRIN